MPFSDLDIKLTGKFVKIEAGVPHDIRLLEDTPDEKIVHGFGKEATICDGEGCLQCVEGHEAKQRFSVNVYDHTVKKALTWEFGATIAKQLKAIDTTMREEGKKITDIDIKVEATGEKMQKKYMITPRMSAKPLPEGAIPF